MMHLFFASFPYRLVSNVTRFSGDSLLTPPVQPVSVPYISFARIVCEEEQVSAMSRESSDHQTSTDEAELTRRVQQGNIEAFEQLFVRFSPRIYRQAMHLLGNGAEAEEIMQEVFLTLYEKAASFRGDAAISTWLYRLTANAAITRLRRRTRNREVLFEDYLPQFGEGGHHQERPVVDWSHDLEQSFVREEAIRLLQQAIDELRPLDKAVVVLSDLEELPQREIGEILGLSVSAVKTRLHRARLFLRGQLSVSLGHSSS